MTTVISRLFDTYEHATQAVQDLEASGIAHDHISIVAANSDGRYGNTSGVADSGTVPATDVAAPVGMGMAGAGATGLGAPMGTTGMGTTGMGATGLGAATGMGMSGAAMATPGFASTGTTVTGEPITAPGASYDTSATGDAAEPATTGAGTGATLGTVLGGGAGLLAGLGMLAIPGVGPVVAAGWLIATLTGAGVGAAGGGLLGSLTGAGVHEDHAHVYAEGVRRGGTLVTVRAEDSQRAMIEQVLARYSPVDPDARGAEYRSSGWSRFDEQAPAYNAGSSLTTGTTTRL